MSTQELAAPLENDCAVVAKLVNAPDLESGILPRFLRVRVPSTARLYYIVSVDFGALSMSRFPRVPLTAFSVR